VCERGNDILKYVSINTGHTQKNGAVLIVNTIKTAPLFCVCPVIFLCTSDGLYLSAVLILQILLRAVLMKIYEGVSCKPNVFSGSTDFLNVATK
jgi:hypothetical protein